MRYIVSRKTPDAADGLRPVLCFLHGNDEAAPLGIEDALTRHGPLKYASNGVCADFIVVAPQLPMRGDIWHRHANAVREIVRHVQAEYGGDARRTYLTGFSFGGNGVFDLALYQPGFWTALWPVDPTRVPERNPVAPMWLSIGGISRFFERRFIASLGLANYGSNATSDRVYLDEGADHVGAATLAYRDSRIYEWLLTKRLA